MNILQISVFLENRTGQLAENHIDVEYMYSLFFHEKGKACMVLRITNEPLFLSVLGTNRVRIVGMDELGLK